MSNTTNQPTEDAITARMTLADVMASRDGSAHVWIDAEHRFAKIVRDGRTLARIDRLTDGTFATFADGTRAIVPTWEAASAWFTARATAEALISALWIPTSSRDYLTRR